MSRRIVFHPGSPGSPVSQAKRLKMELASKDPLFYRYKEECDAMDYDDKVRVSRKREFLVSRLVPGMGCYETGRKPGW